MFLKTPIFFNFYGQVEKFRKIVVHKTCRIQGVRNRGIFKGGRPVPPPPIHCIYTVLLTLL